MEFKFQISNLIQYSMGTCRSLFDNNNDKLYQIEYLPCDHAQYKRTEQCEL